MFNGSNKVFAHSLVIESKREIWGRNPQRLAILGFYYKNNPFLGMFQLKFNLNTFVNHSIFYVCVLKCSILAIILFEYLLLDPNAWREQIVQEECGLPAHYFPRLWVPALRA